MAKLSPLTVTRVIRPLDWPGAVLNVSLFVLVPKVPTRFIVPAPPVPMEPNLSSLLPPDCRLTVLPPA